MFIKKITNIPKFIIQFQNKWNNLNLLTLNDNAIVIKLNWKTNLIKFSKKNNKKQQCQKTIWPT